MEDITLRAIKILSAVDLIAAEDTRVTRKLLTRHGIKTQTTSYHEHNRNSKLPVLMNVLVNQDIALVSDAGMPTISDPGSDLVTSATSAGFKVVPVPGPSALTSSIAASGIVADSFLYIGFVPRKSASRRKAFQLLAKEGRTIVAFETPRRLSATLQDIRDIFGSRLIAVCRELTKIHEEVFRGSADEALMHFKEPRGEFTIVIESAPQHHQSDKQVMEQAQDMIAELRAKGARVRDVVPSVSSTTGLGRRVVYNLWLEEQNVESDRSSQSP